MGIFTADKRLFPMLCQISPDLRHRGVHPAFHIGGPRIAPVMEDSLIMHRPSAVQLPESLRHLVDHAAAPGFVSAGPDQNRRMVLISVITGIHPVQHTRAPLRSVPRHHRIRRGRSPFHRFPASVGFQIIFRNHIQPVPVAKLIQHRTVGIMAGADGIDIMPLHRQHILKRILLRDHPPALTAKFMPVNAVEHNAPPV